MYVNFLRIKNCSCKVIRLARQYACQIILSEEFARPFPSGRIEQC